MKSNPYSTMLDQFCDRINVLDFRIDMHRARHWRMVDNSKKKRFIELCNPWVSAFYLYFVFYTLSFLFFFHSEPMLDGFYLSSVYYFYIIAAEVVSVFFWGFFFFFFPLSLMILTQSNEVLFPKIKLFNWAWLLFFIALIFSSVVLRVESGSFLGVEGLRMLWFDGIQVFQHAIHFYKVWHFVIFSGVLLFFLVLCWAMTYVLARHFSVKVRFTGLGVVCLFFISVFSIAHGFAGFRGTKVVLNVTGESYTTQEYLNKIVIQYAPLSFLGVDLLNSLFSFTDNRGVANVPADMILMREQINSQQYQTLIKEQPKKYNVLVLLVESMRTDQLKAYNSKRDVMPNLDALSQESYIFTRAYAQSSHSNYADVCPLSSHYPLRERRTHFYPKNPPYPRVLLFDILGPLGYKTAIISSQNENWGQMLNYYQNGNIDYLFHSESVSAVDVKKDQSVGAGAGSEVEDWMLKGHRSGKIDDELTISKAIEWINDLPMDQSFAAYINLQSSHFPYSLPKEFKRRFLEKNEKTEAFLDNGKAVDLSDDMKHNAYSDSLFYIDTQIGKLIQALKNSSRYENTIFVISADTSTAFRLTALGKPYIGNGGNLWEDVVHVPLIIKAPGLQFGMDSRLVQHIDVTPTVMGLLGMPQHPSFQGINILDPKAYPKLRSLYLVAQSPTAYQMAIIQEDWFLIHDERYDQVVLYKYPDYFSNVLNTNVEQGMFLLKRLHAWRDLQLDYYGSKEKMKNFYPPILLDEPKPKVDE